ncbi:porin [Chitiniphilus eburneus]|nr:porin [Chitiniphilus eburneus]
MKPLLLSAPLALALLLAASPGQAEVQLDGSFDGALSVNDLGDQTQARADYDVTIGIGGSDQLDGGGQVIWRLEQGITNYTDNATAVFGGKEAWIGYTGETGTLRLGKMKSPLYDLLDARYADTGAKFLLAEYAPGQNVYPGSAIRYDSPEFSGLTVFALYDLDQGDGSHYSYDLGMQFAKAGFFVDGAFQQRKGIDGSDDDAVGNASEFDGQTWFIAGGYDFGNGLGVNVGYKSMAHTPQGGAEIEQELWFAQGSYASGKHSAYLTYMQLGDQGDLDESGAQAMAARYAYGLSKQTIAYVEGRYVWNDENASYGPTDDAYDYVGAPGEDTSRLIAGLKTEF